MCGRFDCHTPLTWVAEDYFGVTRPIKSQAARYNIAPGKAISTVRRSGDDIDLNLMRWGFRPSWAVEDAPRPINARAEKVANSRFFSHAFQHKRCLVLVPANGLFEWMATEQGKQPNLLHRRSQTGRQGGSVLRWHLLGRRRGRIISGDSD